ncbi:DUF222 domain-containing protein [Plantibacter sp. VKM Ac-2880]|uniref:HNH endonuclease signature motif containing protein n=1 Tax=Plantibacter sp. VKM Ac-2880 TaxID=2783827 RepID=UPI0018901C39|nr:HNH endonuclease signature motif containing protein [Plantibacter sp. VKM Ac-2880]MBF4570178.1 DUF222 domain-containing protein [Plantibacter sp. VKM Ac-2880]
MSSSPRVPLGPVSADPMGALSETMSDLLRTWSGALDPIRPGDDAVEQLAGMNDAGVVRVLDQLGAMQHLVEVLATRVMGSVAERSRGGIVGHDPLARSHGYASPAVMLSERWRIPRGRAATITAVAQAITSKRALTGDVIECDRPEIAAAIEPRPAVAGANACEQLSPFDTPTCTVDHDGIDPTDHPRLVRSALSVDGAGALLRELRLVSSGVDADRVHMAVSAGIEHCDGAPLAEVNSLARLVRTSLDQDGPVPREIALRRQQRCTLRELPDGMTELRAFLAPEAAGWVRATMDAVVGKQLRQVRFADQSAIEAGTEDPSAVQPSADPFDDAYVPAAEMPDTRTMDERRVEALVEVFRHAAGCETAVTELAPVSLIIRMDDEDLVDDSPWSDGKAYIDGVSEPITAGTARRMAADGRIIPMVLGGPSQVLDLGVGTRLFSKAQKVALAERDGGCAWTGCTHPPSYTEAHHLQWWSRGGPTDLSNGILLCGFHHHRIHNDGWEVTVRDHVPWFIPPDHVDPHRIPRRGGKPRLRVA